MSAAAALVFAVQANCAVFAESFGSTAVRSAAPTGQVNVSVTPALAMAGSVEFTAELSGNSQTITLDSDSDGGEVCFTNLAQGGVYAEGNRRRVCGSHSDRERGQPGSYRQADDGFRGRY